MIPEHLEFIEFLTARHKVFVSYYHDEDQYYRNLFQERFGHLFITKSVNPGDINSDLSDQYIKRLIQEQFITDTSVLIVLVGPNTWRRKHVDWEISAALSRKVGGYSGLIGILLPTFPIVNDCQYYYRDLPPRLADNARSGYARIYPWPSAWLPDIYVKTEINTAFERRRTDCQLIENWRIQYKENDNPIWNLNAWAQELPSPQYSSPGIDALPPWLRRKWSAPENEQWLDPNPLLTDLPFAYATPKWSE